MSHPPEDLHFAFFFIFCMAMILVTLIIYCVMTIVYECCPKTYRRLHPHNYNATDTEAEKFSVI